jgi:drug/metabolite transporter (DMT)-like permease
MFPRARAGDGLVIGEVGEDSLLSWPFGLLFAFGSALATNVGFLLRHRGARAAPDVDVRHPLRTVAGLFSSKWWTIGFAVAALAWMLHVAALGLAPLSLVQVVLASGFVLLGLLAERFFGFHLGRREWIGIGLTSAGLTVLGITAASEPSSGGARSGYDVAGASAFEAALAGLAILLVLAHGLDRLPGGRGNMLGAAAGLLFTISHIGIKALTGSVSASDPGTWLTPWVPLIVLAFVGAFFASARSLQLGEAVPVIAITSALSNVTAIIGGVVVFGDPLGSTPAVVALRVGAFLLVIVAAMLIPAPVRAAEEAGRERGPRARATAASAT